jgi:double-stranded uracil-DNA glycosylase
VPPRPSALPRTLPRPTAQQLAEAQDQPVPDLVAPGLKVLFVGINPSLWSAVIGHHFGNPANRLWPVLDQAGFTPHRLLPTEADQLLALGYGITNFVNRATATAAEIHDDELRAGADRLEATVERWRPRNVGFLGLQAYRVGFGRPKAAVGLQPEELHGARVWLLPNPSGLNAHYQLPDLVRLYGELRAAADAIEE